MTTTNQYGHWLGTCTRRAVSTAAAMVSWVGFAGRR